MMRDPLLREGRRPELQATADMLRAAYPAGIPDVVYRPLLRLLSEGMSFRRVAEVVSSLTGKPYPVVYNDVLAAASTQEDAEDETVREALRQHGYDKWLMTEM
jgi:hypothetical protein